MYLRSVFRCLVINHTREHLQALCGASTDHHYRDNLLDASASASERIVMLKGVFHAGVCSGWLSWRNSGFGSRDKQIVFDQ